MNQMTVSERGLRFSIVLTSNGGGVEIPCMDEPESKQPNIAEPINRAGYHIEKDWPHLRAAPLAFGGVALVCFVCGFLLAWGWVVASKNATIESLQVASTEKQAKIDGLQKENEKLLKQTLDLKSAIAENATPLKTKARILAQQLLAFSKVQPQNQMKMMDDWGNRFEPRLYEIIKRLDELGQHSDLLNSSVMVGMPPPPAALQTMARELESLAGNLKE